MKRMIMWAIGLLVMVSTANAQLRKGDLLVGGSIGLALDITDTETDIWGKGGTDVNVTFGLAPEVLYMLSDNWYIGGGIGFDNSSRRGKCIHNWSGRRILRTVQQEYRYDEYRKYGFWSG